MPQVLTDVANPLQSPAGIKTRAALRTATRKASSRHDASSAPLPNRWNARGPLLIIAAVTLFTFSRTFTCDFVMWDDDMVIYRNTTLTPPTLHSLKVWWTTPDIRMWNPLTETMRGLLALFTTNTVDPVTHSRLNPYIFHANDVILHVLTTLILYQVLRLLGFRNWPACAGAACLESIRCRWNRSYG